MFNYQKKELLLEAKAKNFNTNTYEKVLRLCDVLKFISNSKFKNMLVLKGGTAINLFLLKLPRLSVDADFDFSLSSSKEEMLEVRKEISKEINEFMLYEGYELSSRSKTTHSLDSFVYRYQTLSNSYDILKIEINYSDRIHVLKNLSTNIIADLNQDLMINRLNDNELIGSKFNALLLRTTPRDFYDAYNLFKEYKIDELVKKIAIFYICISEDLPINIESILTNSINIIKSFDYNRLRETLIPLLHKGEKLNIEEMKEYVINNITKLFTLNDNEKLFISKFNEGIFEEKLLFEEYEVNDLSNHPMVIWKTMKH